MVGIEYQNGYHSGYEQRKLDEKKERCYWYYDEDGFWRGECGAAWEFTTGGPSENKVRHCIKCGKRIKSYEPRTEGKRLKVKWGKVIYE